MTDKTKKLLMLYEQSSKRKILEDVPPLTFKGYGKDLKNYRIYGNTVNGESVGDRTGNLFDNNITIENGAINSITGADSSYQYRKRLRTSFISVPSAGTYTINVEKVDRINCIVLYSSQNTDAYIETIIETALVPKTFTVNVGGYIRIVFSKLNEADITPSDISNIMFNSGSSPLPYEPYGYRVPVTVTDGTNTQTTNIYLPEQIKMIDDEAEYIDYAEQKQYFADGTSADVELPALPTIAGTNTLSVGTEVQPSKVIINGKIKEV